MNKKIGIIALIAIFLLIAGQACPRRAREEVIGSKYRVGNEGLILSFIRNMPPPKIYDEGWEETPLIGIEVRNKGAWPSPDEECDFNACLYLRGFDTNYLDFYMDGGKCKGGREITDLCGKSRYNPEGEYMIEEFKPKNIDLYEAESYKPLLLATACYEYNTLANPVVCIDPDPFGIEVKEKVCTPKDVGLSSQGAPIAVTRIEQTPSKEKTQFKIYVQNVGGGIVYDYRDVLTRCPGDITHENLGKVDYSVNMGIKTLDCKPTIGGQQAIKLYDNQGFFVCSLDGISGDAYTTPLNIKLEYGYMSSISKQLEIIKTP